MLDVAGGQGVLSFEFSKRDLACTVVDPRPISGVWTQKRARYLGLRKKIAEELGSRPEVRSTCTERLNDVLLTASLIARLCLSWDVAQPTFRHLQCLFDASFLTNASTAGAWRAAPLVVGLHPDEATDPIVTLSLAAGKPFAVVPCCGTTLQMLSLDSHLWDA